MERGMLNFIINRSILTQVGILFLMFFILWFYGISSLLNKLTEQQLEIQARTVVDNVNTLGQGRPGF
jgi:ABC-type bacteriocin/lantibiotic exporter with double-glycine peptidase domain